MFYPILKRRGVYETKGDGSFYSYKRYHAEIAQDCQERCVYCDIRLPEIGYEGFHLDHFRPQHHFPDLVNNPFNLIIACPKCNVLKSSYWPAGSDPVHTHNGVDGFFDPFDCNRLDFFRVNGDGEIVSIRPPAAYMIELLQLNRMSRKFVRRNRMVAKRVSDILEFVLAESEAIEAGSDGVAISEVKERLQYLRGVAREAVSLNRTLSR